MPARTKNKEKGGDCPLDVIFQAIFLKIPLSPLFCPSFPTRSKAPGRVLHSLKRGSRESHSFFPSEEIESQGRSWFRFG